MHMRIIYNDCLFYSNHDVCLYICVLKHQISVFGVRFSVRQCLYMGNMLAFSKALYLYFNLKYTLITSVCIPRKERERKVGNIKVPPPEVCLHGNLTYVSRTNEGVHACALAALSRPDPRPLT